MMDFDLAADRLQKDQQSALARSRAQRAARTASSKAKRDAAAARADVERRLKEKQLEVERKARVVNRVTNGINGVEKALGVVDVSGASGKDDNDSSLTSLARRSTASSDLFERNPMATGWKLNATSIYGEGDKIALPPSILETLTSSSYPDLDPWGSGQSGRPLAFRVGVLNPDYAEFPSSQKMKAVVAKMKEGTIALESSKSSDLDDSHEQSPQDHDTEDMDVSDDEAEASLRDAYLDELSHRYLAYTHGTVVEFTQEDGCVGLPEPIAQALLNPNTYSMVGNGRHKNKIPTKRTVDPASAVNMPTDIDNPMDTESTQVPVDSDDGEKTPGHPAYGKFDVPAGPIEITPIKSLPPGTDCTFTPTASSIQNGFYNLKDVKLVLEQSLMRTRATLSRGDVIRTWRRGVSFDLIVSKVSPGDYGVVSCVNTDLNVDIGPPEGMESEDAEIRTGEKPLHEYKANETTGRTLSEPSERTNQSNCPPSGVIYKSIELPPEPTDDESTGVCVVQIRGIGSNSSGRRRFRVTTATMKDLFAFASHVGGEGFDGVSAFCLVTRFPRKVYRLSSSGGKDCYQADDTLESAGIAEGQVLFMIE
ncbi:hypothetical protein HJC23_005716 [Cyclotella cryptica]|uniref:UBX domain-containing protein n=1 Tax=Cyclotella cryptica TaxID=29204 RepID=A0ABD3QCN5_9STRA|eukprot:CCRYP_006421-RA/>CCRYP_006421-RA protein AED:0.00 eAED:-0.00 QI:0/-1/0/1/-1/1/1/0/592